jgi:hypothetical protein
LRPVFGLAAVQAWSFWAIWWWTERTGTGPGSVETEHVEHLDDVVGDAQLVGLRAADLVVAELEAHRQPTLTPVGESDVERQHDVVLGHSLRLRRIQLDDRARKPGPPLGELVAELGQVVPERD